MCTVNEIYSKLSEAEKFEELEQDLWIAAAEDLGVGSEELVMIDKDRCCSRRKAYYDRGIDTIIVDSGFFENAEYAEIFYVCMRELYIKYLWELVQKIKYKKADENIELARKLKLWKVEFKYFYENKIIFREPHPDNRYYEFDIETEANKFAKKMVEEYGIYKEM